MNSRNAFRLACALAVSVWVPAAFAALGDACHWTGNGGNAYWTNAFNWAEGRVPGRYLVPDPNQTIGYSTNGVTGEVAIFGDDLVAGGATTIDFSGVYSISNIVTTGTANRYTYGASASQYVPLEPWGGLTAAELSNTPVALVAAKIRCGVELKNGLYDPVKGTWTYWYGKETIRFRNNSASEEFVIANSWGNQTYSAFCSPGGGQTGIQVEGTGDIRISYAYNGGAPFFYDRLSTGKLVIDTKFGYRAMQIQPPAAGDPSGANTLRRIEITANGALASSEGNQDNLSVSYPLRIYGDGYFAFTAGWVSGTYWSSGGVAVGSDLTIECTTKFRVSDSKTDAKWAALASWPYRIVVTGASGYTMRLLGNTTIGQEVVLPDWTTAEDPASTVVLGQIYNGNRHNYCARTFTDDAKTFGPCAYELAGGSTVRYEGTAAETLTRGIAITNITTAAGRLEQAGTGVWTVSSAVTTADGASSSTLYLSTAAGGTNAVFTGTVDAKVTVIPEYGGKWTFSPSDGQCAKLSLPGGRLDFGARAISVGEITATVGTTLLMVPDGCTLNVGKLDAASGKIVDFQLLGANAQVTIDPAAANNLAGLRLNGHSATLDSDGHPQMVTGTANIWKLPVSGAWGDATKWAGGTEADPLKETYIDVSGAPYEVKVDGQDVTITNLYLGGANGAQATLVITNNAHFTVEGRTHLQSILTMKKNAGIKVHDSELKLFNRGNAVGNGGSTSMMSLGGGSITVTGNGKFIDYGIPMSKRTDGGKGNLNGFLYFGSGNVDFYDDAEFKTDYEEGHSVQYHYIRPDRAGETARLALHDRARFNFKGAPWNLLLMGNGGRAVIDCDTAYTGQNLRLYSQVFIGHGTGEGDLFLRSGRFYMGNYYIHVGTTTTSDKSATATGFATGRVEVASSAYCYAYCSSGNGVGGFSGLTLGQGLPLNLDRGKAYVHGEMKVAGIYEQERGSFIVGGGPNGDGELEQTGGEMKVVDKSAYENSTPLGEMMVGVFGGNGRVKLTDGTFSTRRNVYVGGVTTNDLRLYHSNGDRLQQFHDANGSLRVLGGSFVTTKAIVLGRDGTGTLELSGTGTVTAASLVVSNTAGQAASTLKFTADAHGRCGAIAPTTALKFYEGAKMVVDVSANPVKRVKVLDLDTAPEGLDSNMIELVGADGVTYPHRLEISADFRKIVYTVDKGMRLILR